MTTEEKAAKQAELHFKMLCNYTSPEELIKRAYRAGYFAGANEALASQWVSVEERLPEIGELVVAAHIGFVTATYDGEDWYDANDHLIRPTHWLPIPPLKGGDE